ncbi:MAG: TolC family protein [Methylococcaceae bacterium]|nr:TolC family protein [Methylococcaceae bacterium]
MIRLLPILILAWSGARAGEPAALELTEVLDAATRAFPGLLAAQQRQEAAAGERLAAEGGFDTLLKAQGRWSIAGLYENRNYDVVLEQPTGLWGTTFFGGWRRGTGDYPVYEGKSLTAADGEARLGVNIPLWRNGPIDRRRATLQQAELGETIAGQDVDLALIDLRRISAHRYWDWVLAGQRLRIAETLLAVAEGRDAGLRERVAAGDLPEFEVLDNQRAILERRERVVAAQRLQEQTAIALSLYYRDAAGQPRLPEAPRQPPAIPPAPAPRPAAFDEANAQAQARRPELQRLELQRRQAETELALQQNQQAPGIDLTVMGAQDFGSSKGKPNREELYAGVNIDIPLQRRVAGGRAQVARANLQRLDHERRLAEDRIAAEVRDALSALAAAGRRLELASRQKSAAGQLEDGERTRFELGDSTLLLVNLREIARGDAALLEADAAIALHKAAADFQAALGARPAETAAAER